MSLVTLCYRIIDPEDTLQAAEGVLLFLGVQLVKVKNYSLKHSRLREGGSWGGWQRENQSMMGWVLFKIKAQPTHKPIGEMCVPENGTIDDCLALGKAVPLENILSGRDHLSFVPLFPPYQKMPTKEYV